MAPKEPKKWAKRTSDDRKRIEIQTDTRSGVRVWVDNDDVMPRDAARVAAAIHRLPHLLEVERLVKEMFTEGVLDPYPTSDASHEYRLRRLTGWKRKVQR